MITLTDKVHTKNIRLWFVKGVQRVQTYLRSMVTIKKVPAKKRKCLSIVCGATTATFIGRISRIYGHAFHS